MHSMPKISETSGTEALGSDIFTKPLKTGSTISISAGFIPYQRAATHSIDADAAQKWGLINRAVADTELDQEVDSLCTKIAEKSPLTVSTGKQAFYRQIEMGLDEAYDYASQVMTENMLAKDAEEGIDAFLQKRPPVWCGK